MRIEWMTKWGLGGWHKCRATGALDEAGKSSLVSGGAEMWRNSISYHPALYIANCLFWKARKKNFQLFRALKPQPTSWVGWGTWLSAHTLPGLDCSSTCCNSLVGQCCRRLPPWSPWDLATELRECGLHLEIHICIFIKMQNRIQTQIPLPWNSTL